MTAFVSWEMLQLNAIAMSARDSVLLKYLCLSFVYAAAASTLIAEFLSTLASAVEPGFRSTLPFVKLIISAHPWAVVSSGCGGCGEVSGHIVVPGTTSWILGKAATLKIIVYWSGVTASSSSARAFAAAAYSLYAACNLVNTLLIQAHASLDGRLCSGNLVFKVCDLGLFLYNFRFLLLGLKLVGHDHQLFELLVCYGVEDGIDSSKSHKVPYGG